MRQSAGTVCPLTVNRLFHNGGSGAADRARALNPHPQNRINFADNKHLWCDSDEAARMTAEEETELRAQLAQLQQEHRDLDTAIAALQGAAGSDLLQIQRLKKRKLVLRDRISFIEDALTPDIIA